MSTLLISCSLLAALVATIYFYVKNAFSYWQRRGVPFLKPTFPFGNFGKTFSAQLCFHEALEETYNSTTEPVIGVYATIQPLLLVRDPKVLQDILISEFSSFYHRGAYANEQVDAMAGNMFLLNGEKWRKIRSTLGPTFTTTKLKGMFDAIVTCSHSLHKYIGQFADSGKTVEVHDVFARYATSVIASVAFGIEIDCIENPQSEFRSYGRRVFAPTLKNVFRSNLSFFTPKLAALLRLRFADKDIGDFMIETVRQNLEYRETNNVVRKDFFQLLMQLRNTGNIKDDDDWSAKATNNEKSLSLEELAAQAYVFFIASYESSSTTLAFAMYEFAKDQDAQTRAFNEISDVLANYNGKLTYESMGEMKYMECCIDEILRMHPPFGLVTRRCTKDYKLPNSNIVIEKDTSIIIPVPAFHYDPKYYDQPKKFMPERFLDETAKKSFVEQPFLPFGEGPRICPGSRLAKLQVKIALVTLLQRYIFELGLQHVNKELKFDPKGIAKTPIGGINLKAKVR